MITRLTQDDLTDNETAKCSKAGGEKMILIGATLMVSQWINVYFLNFSEYLFDYLF